MKKIMLMFLIIGANLFADTPNDRPYVYMTWSAVNVNGDYYGLTDSNNANTYKWEVLLETSPNASSGYISPTTVKYAHSEYRHMATEFGIKIYIHFPASIPSSDRVYISERNEYERENGYNSRIIENGYSVSQYQLNVYPQTDGSKVIEYSVPDMSAYHKRITIATCPNHGTQSTVQCKYTAFDIAGFSSYNK